MKMVSQVTPRTPARKAAVNTPHSRRFARSIDRDSSRQRLECGGFSTALSFKFNEREHAAVCSNVLTKRIHKRAMLRIFTLRRQPAGNLDHANRRPVTATLAYTLIEMLVYMSVLLVLLGIGYAALYRSMDNATALRESTDDIINAIHAGENWRADVRAAHGNIRLESSDAEQILSLPGSRGRISYRFAANTISRRIGGNDWTPVLANVKTSDFIADARQNVKAWRWELELRTHPKRVIRIRPLFTFIAVPAGDQAQ